MAIDFIPEFRSPFFLLLAAPEGFDEAKVFARAPNCRRASGAGRKLVVAYDQALPVPRCSEDPGGLTVTLGHPIVGEKIDKAAAAAAVFKFGAPDHAALKSLNGEFTFFRFDANSGELHVVNDRFTAYPVYYYHDPVAGIVLATPYFSELWSALRRLGKLRLRQDALFEFLWLQRLLGDKTFAVDAFYLPDASVATFMAGKLSISRYWRRDYSKNSAPLEENSRLMAELTRRSVRRKSSDGKRYGHFLSGGMDSRSVLAAFEANPPTCFTATISENREQVTARAIAQAKGAKHVALTLDPEHYGKILAASVRTNGGMYNYDHGLFYGFNRAVSDLVDVAFHGHGFDYMFQGMYIPRKLLRVAGRNLSYKTLDKVPDDIVSYYIDQVSYRSKNADIPAYLKPDRKAAALGGLRSSVESVLAMAKDLSDDPYDHWEHLTFHYISRHYSYPNHASIATFVEQRAASFDNDLFDLYLSLPVEQRFDARIERRCLRLLDPALARIPSANTSYPVTASSFEQTLHQLWDSVKRRLRGQADFESWKERTWPDRTTALRTQKTLRDAVMAMVSSDAIDQVEALDAAKLKAGIPKWLDGEKVPGLSGDFVQTLLSLCVFLRQS